MNDPGHEQESVSPHEATTGQRRTAGGGSIDQRANGRFRVRFSTTDGRRRSTTFATEDEAQRFLDATLVELAEADLAPVGGVTLAGWGGKWLDRREENGGRAIRSERSSWATHIATAKFIDWPLARITRRDVKDWVEALTRKKALAPARWKKGPGKRTDRPLSRQSVMHALNLLRKCIADALEDEIFTGTNPAKDVRVPARPSTADTWSYLTPAEIEAVTSCPEIEEENRLVLTVAIYTGLRQGELWGIHWSDVHLDSNRPELVVRHSHKGPTKNGKIRHVPLLGPAQVALKRLKELYPRRTVGLVFTTVTGCRRPKSDDAGWRDRRLSKDVVKQGHKTLAGITRRVRFHDLRHTCASHLLMGTWGRAWKLEEVRDFLGHSDISVTQRYAHLSADHLQRAASETVVTPAQGPAKVPPRVSGTVRVVENPMKTRSERATGIEPATFSLGS